MAEKSKIIIALLIMSVITSSWAESLNDAVRRAMRGHPEILQGEMQAQAAGQEMAEARGAYYPTVDFNGGFGREKTESPITQDLAASNITILNRIELSGNATQNLFAGGGITGEFERSMQSFLSKNYKKIGTANDIALDVTQAYFDVLLQLEIIKISKVNLRKHEALLNLTKQRALAGIARAAEMNQARARVNLAKTNLYSAEGNYQEARLKYRKVVGHWPENLKEPKPPSSESLPATTEKALDIGIIFHPLMRAAQADIYAARAEQKKAAAGFFPKVDAVLSASRNRSLDGLPGKNFDNLAMIRASWNAFKGGSDLASTRKNAYRVQEAIQTRNNTLIDMRETIGLAYNAWKITSKKLVELKKYVYNTQKTKEAYFEQYKIGKRTLLDLLNVQNEEYRAEKDYLQTKNDKIIAKYRILNSIGALLPFLDEHCSSNCLLEEKGMRVKA